MGFAAVWSDAHVLMSGASDRRSCKVRRTVLELDRVGLGILDRERMLAREEGDGALAVGLPGAGQLGEIEPMPRDRAEETR